MHKILTTFGRLPLLAGLLVLAACDNPVEPTEHPEAGGVVILHAGTGATLATSVGAGTTFTAPLEIGAGESIEVEILFLDASAPNDLTRAFHPHDDDGESLRVRIADTSIVSFEEHGDHGDFVAGEAGQTTVQFDLMHGSHADFTSGNLTVIVN